MLKPNEIEKFSTILDKPVKALENEIMEDIVRRIKINGEITRSADWQMHRLYEMGMAKDDIQKAIKNNLNLSDEDIHEMYVKAVKSGYVRDKEIYMKAGVSQIPFAENLPLQQLISAVAEQTSGQMKNLSQSLGFAVRQPDGTLAFTGAEEFYQQTLDNAVMGISSGTFDYVTAIKKAILTMTNSGLRTVDYATGWSNRTAVAARRAVVTGLSQITAKVNEDNAKALKTEYFEVTWHSGARPTHQEWQGKVYTKSQLETVCGLGTVTGLCGANCYHDYYPFIPGISERTYTDEQLEKLNAEDNKKREYQGKEYTKYEALQRQRHLETSIRAKREQIHLLEVADVPEEDIINARCRYQGTLQEYNRFSREMDLPVQRDRIYVDGWGNIGVGKVTGGSGKKSPIELEKVIKKSVEKVVPKEPKYKFVKATTIEEAEKFATDNDDVTQTPIDKFEKSGIIKEEKFYPLLDNSFDFSSNMEQLKAAWEPLVSQNVTDDEWQGINGGYVRTPNSFRINDKLRNNPGAKIEELFKDPFDLKTVRDLDSAIDKNTLNRNVLLTRNVGLDYLTSALGLSTNDVRSTYQLIKDEHIYKDELKWLNDKLIGKEVVENAFLSTSGNLSLNIFSNKPVRLEIKAPKGTKALVTKNFMESEVILGRGTKYTIERVERFAIDKSSFGLKIIVKVV